MTHVPPLLFFFVSSSLPGAADASVLCAWTRALPGGELHSIFLRTAPSPRLYHGAWSRERALLACAWSDDAAVIRDYVSLCRERPRDFSGRPDGRFDLVLEAEGLCVSMDTPEVPQRSVRSVGGAQRSEVRGLRRAKRGFIVPGTLWCGSGNKAPSYGDLGVFAETDSCCREHDQCKHTILSFHSGFGVFNSNIFTMSHCDCDNRFHSCLKEANDSISDVVGYSFFNLLKMHCFEFSHRLQCTERNWFGMCKETEMAAYAEVHPPTMYEPPAEKHANRTSCAVNTTSPTDDTSRLQLLSITAAAPTFPPPSTTPPSAYITPGANATASTAANTPESRSPGPAPDPQNATSTKHDTLIVADVTVEKKKKHSCAAFKDLDECRNKIPPLHTGFGLYNPDATTLYHCNCTSRLFQTLARQRQLTALQPLVLGHVSPSCFLPQDCTAGKICAAVLVKAELPQLNSSSSADMEEQRHLQAVRLKVRRPNIRRAQRKPIRLHKLCLRMVRTKLSKSRKAEARRRPAARRRERV